MSRKECVRSQSSASFFLNTSKSDTPNFFSIFLAIAPADELKFGSAFPLGHVCVRVCMCVVACVRVCVRARVIPS